MDIKPISGQCLKNPAWHLFILDVSYYLYYWKRCHFLGCLKPSAVSSFIFSKELTRFRTALADFDTQISSTIMPNYQPNLFSYLEDVSMGRRATSNHFHSCWNIAKALFPAV